MESIAYFYIIGVAIIIAAEWNVWLLVRAYVDCRRESRRNGIPFERVGGGRAERMRYERYQFD